MIPNLDQPPVQVEVQDPSVTADHESAAASSQPDVPPPLLSPPPLMSALSPTYDETINSTTKISSDDIPVELPADDSDDESDKETTSSAASAEIKILKSLNLKTAGNDFFKTGDYDKAVRSYRQGTSALKSLNLNNTGDEQVKGLLVGLQNNISMIFAKQLKWKQCKDVSTSCLDIDPANLKALFRRGVAFKNLGDYDNAKKDFKKGLEVDSTSKDIRKELIVLNKLITDLKNKEKLAFSGAFKGGGGGLYDDKAEEAKVKKEEKEISDAAKVLKLSEEIKANKVKWEDECVARMSRSEPPISYDEWSKEIEAKVKKEEEEKKKEEKAEKKRKKERDAESKRIRDAEKKLATKDDESSEEEGGTDDKKSENVRGYKLNSEGQKTSFFNNDLTPEAKALIGDIAPKKIENAAIAAAPVSIPGDSNASSWNSAGTWEERDTTEWCKTSLSATLSSVTIESGVYNGVVSKVEEVVGDASVVLIRGKKRYLFDFTCKLEFQVKNGSDKIVGSGTITLSDVSSTAADEETWDFETVFKVGGGDAGVRGFVGGELRKVVESGLDRFVKEFNDEY